MSLLVLLYGFATFYSVFVFIQFGVVQILSVAGIFLLLFSIFCLIFKKGSFKFQKIKAVDFVISVPLACFLNALLFSQLESFHSYFNVFPLFESEMVGMWHKDSAFHAAIIQSFKNFGFSSTGQDGTPVIVYHVLSHFLDSLIVRFSNVDVWESYGLLYYFKSLLLVCSIIVFIKCTVEGRDTIVFVLSIILFTPVVTGSWHAVSSHGLWFPSILLIFSAGFVFRLIVSNRPLRVIDFFFLFTIAILVSMGKVSSGFMFSVFIGVSLWLSFLKDWRVYVFGVVLVFFFWLYQENITVSREMGLPDFKYILDFLLLKYPLWGIQGQVYVLIGWLCVMAMFDLSGDIFKMVASSIFSVLTLGILFSMQPDLSKSDRWYFMYGIYFILLLVVYQIFIKYFLDSKSFIFFKISKKIFLATRFSLIFLFCVSAGTVNNSLKYTKFDIFSPRFYKISAIFEWFDSGFFQNIRKIDGLEDVQISKLFADRNFIEFDSYERPLKRFRESLHNFVEANDLRVTDTLLLVPREVYEESLSRFGGEEKYRGLLLYAVTGIPLFRGVYTLEPIYGFSDYDETATLLPTEAITSMSFEGIGRNVILVKDFFGGKFEIVNRVQQ